MTETKNGQRPSNGDADRSPSPDRVVTDGPTGLRRFEEAMRRIFRTGRIEKDDDARKKGG